MTDFSRLDRAENWLAAVSRSFITRAARAGSVDAWNYAPEHARSRERGARLLARSANRLDREVSALHAAGVPQGVTRARLRDRAFARDAASRAARTQAPLTRASR
jgi:hypothetical protein